MRLKLFKMNYIKFIIIFGIVFLVVVFKSDWESDLSLHKGTKSFFTYHKPESFINNAINHYSVIHFFQYAAISLIKFINLWQIIVFSVLWEIFELLTHFEWGRESWLNKLCDIFFNISGFYFGRRFLKISS